jgi:hypothetical protein
MEAQSYRMRVLLVLINDEERPGAIRSLHRVSSYQRMSRTVLYVAVGRVNSMCIAAALQPFEINQLAREELPKRLTDLAICSNGKHAKSPVGIIASTMHAHRNVVEVVDGVPTSLEERPYIVRQVRGSLA